MWSVTVWTKIGINCYLNQQQIFISIDDHLFVKKRFQIVCIGAKSPPLFVGRNETLNLENVLSFQEKNYLNCFFLISRSL